MTWNAKKITTDPEMMRAVAARMLHRLVEHIVEDAVHAATYFEDDSAIVASIRRLDSPIICSMRVICDVVGASQDTKVLIAVDDITQAPKPGSDCTSMDALSILAGVMDIDLQRRLHLSASVHGCLKLRKLPVSLDGSYCLSL
jgi:hypothetical protein